MSSHDRILRARGSLSTGTNHSEGPKPWADTQVGYQPYADSSHEPPAAADRHVVHQVEAAGGASPQLAQRRPAHERSAARCQRTSRAQFLHARSVTRALVDQLCTACAERIMTAKVSLDEQRGAYEGGSAALRWGRDVRQREPGLNTYQLRLMAACTVATALNDGREQVGGGGREGIIAVSTRHVRLQTANDSDADTSRERGIDEISAW